jgi:hypothetical protein
MDKLAQLLSLATECFKAEYGQDAQLEDGEEFATVFNDGVLVIGLENGKSKVNLFMGEPYKIDFTIGFLDE